MANKIYYEFLLSRYIQEIIAIEKGNIKPVKVEDFKEQLVSRIRNDGF